MVEETQLRSKDIISSIFRVTSIKGKDKFQPLCDIQIVLHIQM